MPPLEKARAFSLGGAPTEMDPWLCAEAHCPSSSDVRAGHGHACSVGITRGVQGSMILCTSTPLSVDNGMCMVHGAL